MRDGVSVVCSILATPSGLQHHDGYLASLENQPTSRPPLLPSFAGYKGQPFSSSYKRTRW